MPRPHWADDLRRRIDELIDEHRASLHDCLEGLIDDEACMSLVPSKDKAAWSGQARGLRRRLVVRPRRHRAAPTRRLASRQLPSGPSSFGDPRSSDPTGAPALAKKCRFALWSVARPPTGERATSHGRGRSRSAIGRAAVGVVVAVAEQVEHCPVGVRCGGTVSERRNTSFVARGARCPHHDA